MKSIWRLVFIISKSSDKYSHDKHLFMKFNKSISLIIASIFFFCDATFSQNRSDFVLDMVHNNPGEPLTKTVYNDPTYLEKQGFDGMVVNDFTFVQPRLLMIVSIKGYYLRVQRKENGY